MKNSNDIGNRTRDLPTCSVAPQPTALRRTPVGTGTALFLLYGSGLSTPRPGHITPRKHPVPVLQDARWGPPGPV